MIFLAYDHLTHQQSKVPTSMQLVAPHLLLATYLNGYLVLHDTRTPPHTVSMRQRLTHDYPLVPFGAYAVHDHGRTALPVTQLNTVAVAFGPDDDADIFMRWPWLCLMDMRMVCGAGIQASASSSNTAPPALYGCCTLETINLNLELCTFDAAGRYAVTSGIRSDGRVTDAIHDIQVSWAMCMFFSTIITLMLAYTHRKIPCSHPQVWDLMRPLHMGPLAANRPPLHDTICMAGLHKPQSRGIYKPRLSDDGRHVLIPDPDGNVQVWYVSDEGRVPDHSTTRPLRLERSPDLRPMDGEPVLGRSMNGEPLVRCCFLLVAVCLGKGNIHPCMCNTYPHSWSRVWTLRIRSW